MKLRYCEKKMIYFSDLEADCESWHYDKSGAIVCDAETEQIIDCWPGNPGCPLVCEVLSMDPEIVVVDKEVTDER